MESIELFFQLLMMMQLLIFSPVSSQANCPSFCVCSTWYELPKASCSGKHLYSINTGLPNIVQALDLFNNSIISLEDRGFSRAGLTQLKFLNLSMNTISEIGIYAFEDLKSLKVLDLSMNRIDFINTGTFNNAQSLQILNLAGNKFNRHVPIIHSSSIMDLNLSGCRISSLSDDTFLKLKRLRKLNLSNNMLQEINSVILTSMTNLKEVQLGDNPWTCEIKFFDMKIKLRNAKVLLDHPCEKPMLQAQFEKILAIETEKTTKKTDLDEETIAEDEETLWDVKTWHKYELLREKEQQELNKKKLLLSKQPIDDEDNENDDEEENDDLGLFSVQSLSNVSPYWLLLTGFLLGSGATLFITYLSISATFSCRKIRAETVVDSSEINSQRISLLRHLWQQENLPVIDDINRGTTYTSCPGTPPPPYREVMLHRNLYPRAAMVAAAQQATIRG